MKRFNFQRPSRPRLFLVILGIFTAPGSPMVRPGLAQVGSEAEIVRAGPPELDQFEGDSNRDGVPDGWYNARDVVIVPEGGKVGPHLLRFKCDRRGRPARLSRAFGVDGRKIEAVILGLWIRQANVQVGERTGEEPGLIIDFLGDALRHESRGIMGPWSRSVGSQWTRVVKRIPVPPATRDAILSVGLMGATGVLDIDGLTVTLMPVGGEPTSNLVVNGDFEIGDPAPAGWSLNGEVHRAFPGFESHSSIELARSGSRALAGLGMPLDGVGSLELSLMARAQGLRGSSGATASLFFLDDNGQILPVPGNGEFVLQWGGSFDWRNEREVVRVPQGASRAVLQLEKSDNLGSIRFDAIQIKAAPNPDVVSWTPYHVGDDTGTWPKLSPSPTIQAGSALDFSFLLPHPAGKQGRVMVKEGKLFHASGGRARFHGVSLLAPTAFLEPERAQELAERLSRSGINLVRLGDLDTPLGPGRSLLDDTRDDTKALDESALERLDHLVAAMETRGIHIALELQSNRRFRTDDNVKDAGLLPPGGGPAAVFDPTIVRLATETARAFLSRPNGETGRSLNVDPALAWVTLSGEISLFDLIDRPDALTGEYAGQLHAMAQKSPGGTGRRFWQSIEQAHWKAMADALRKGGLKAPIAGVSHWRREAEFSAAQAGQGLDLIDDRLFWSPPPWISPDIRSQLWSLEGGLLAGAAKKRHAGRPYVVGQWCPQTLGAWGLPHEAADQLLAAYTAAVEDWDALVRRGVFLFPLVWGEGPVGTNGVEDIFQIPEVANGCPQVYSLWPHCASLLLRVQSARTDHEREGDRGQNRRKNRGIPGWDASRGRLMVDTPHTQGLAGWTRGETARLTNIEVQSDSPFAVIVASAVGPEPIGSARRLLVTAIARVEPTDFRWVDSWKQQVADPGRPPFLQEPVSGRVTWRRKGKLQAHALDNTGTRVGQAKFDPLADGEGGTLVIEDQGATVHWELTAD